MYYGHLVLANELLNYLTICELTIFNCKFNVYLERNLVMRSILTLRKRRIIIDVDTQRDLFLAEGSACVWRHRKVLTNIRRVMAASKLEHMKVISTVRVCCNPKRGDVICVAGTPGSMKLRYTVRQNYLEFGTCATTDFPRDALIKHDQLILSKRVIDPFDEPRAERVFTEAKASEFLVIGGYTEDAVYYTAMGLLTRGKSVTVLIDAIGSRNKNAARHALNKMEAKGVRLVESKLLFGCSSLRQVRTCECARCMAKFDKVCT